MTEISKNDKLLIVVAIAEGRNFYKRNGWSLVIEAQLDGEIMSTDAVHHEETPNFGTELAWEVDKRGFKLFRVQRIPIKLKCFAIDEGNLKNKELLGFVVLDLRSVNPKPQKAKWYPLSNPKYYWMKPEIRLCVSLEKDNGGIIEDRTQNYVPRPTSQVSSNRSPKVKLDYEKPIPSMPIPSIEPQLLKPILNEEGGFYQIGPSNATDMFSLSVTIVFAGNLAQLTPSDIHLPDNHDGFYFYYSLLTNDVTTDTFPDLIEPNFAAERAAVRIRSSVDILRQFLKLQSGIKIHVCTGDISLGCTNVSLAKLLPENSTEIFMNPVSLEGMFELSSMDEGEKGKIPQDLRPFVGLSVTLRMEDQKAKVIVLEPSVLNENNARPKTPPQRPKSPVRYPQSPPVKLVGSNRRNEESRSNFDIPSTKFIDEDRLAAGHDDIDNSKSMLHRFCFTLDMRYIRFTHVDHNFLCFLRYSYHYFGSASTIITHPLLDVTRGAELRVPHGLCSFTFADSPERMTRALQTIPLNIEVVKRDKNRNEDVIIGMIRLDLSKVLDAGKCRVVTAANEAGFRQSISTSGVICSLDDEMKILGNLEVVMGLADYGLSVLPPEINPVPSYVGNQIDPQKLISDEKVTETKPKIVENENTRFDLDENQKEMAMEFALELEEWKRIQQEEFRKELKSKESYYMESLINEWRKRDTEREVIFQRKLRECKELEDKLRLALSDAAKREKLLVEKEMEVEQSKSDFEMRRDQQHNEIKMGYLRLREEFQHQLQVERQRCLESENQKEKLSERIKDLERKLDEKTKEFDKFRENQRHNPQLRLQSELNVINLEKNELERKLEASTKSKVHYKQQWGRSLRELARIKQKSEADARAHLYRQQQELEDMRLQYLAAEENEKTTGDGGKENGDKRSPSDGVESLRSKSGKQISFMDLISDDESDDVMRNDLEALVKERATLLSSGIYVESDRIIKELDKEIATLKN